MRNPWGLHFDKKGRLWCADVGQALWEEVNLIEKGGNYGWSYREGAHEFPLNRNPELVTEKGKDPIKLIDPVHEYGHAYGISIKDPCTTCRGEGRIEELTRIKLKVPPGISHGSRIRSSGNGEAGLRGGTPGDLYVVIHIAKHDKYQR